MNTVWILWIFSCTNQATLSADSAWNSLEQMRQRLIVDDASGLDALCRPIATAIRQDFPQQEKLVAEVESSCGAFQEVERGREAFSVINQAMLYVAGLDSTDSWNIPDGWKVYSCPMVSYFPKWVQPQGDMGNPYMGSKMLGCGMESDGTVPKLAQETSVDPHSIAHYTCPMHPNVTSPDASTCPICNMDLVPVYEGDLHSGSVLIDSTRRDKFHMQTTVVQRGDLVQKRSWVGRVQADLLHQQMISLRVQGWIQSVSKVNVGTCVQTGDTLATVYAPDVYNALLELQQGQSDGYLRVVQEKLFLYGVPLDWIRETTQQFKKTGKRSTDFPIQSGVDGCITESFLQLGRGVQKGETVAVITDLHHVLVVVEQYGEELLNEGDTVQVVSDSNAFSGIVRSVLPQRKHAKHSVQVAVETDGSLQIGEVVRVEQEHNYHDQLLVPINAVLRTGRRDIVFVEEGQDKFRPQEVNIVSMNRDMASIQPIPNILDVGSNIVAQGVFFVAAESRIQSATTFWATDNTNNPPESVLTPTDSDPQTHHGGSHESSP